jgi:hypothetical protein
MADWLLITWTTHGAWLPGDPRGFRSASAKKYVPPPGRYAKNGEETYEAEEYAKLHEFHKSAVTPVFLSMQHFLAVSVEAKRIIAKMTGGPAVVSIGRDHVHCLVNADELWIERLVKNIKGASSRRLSEHGLPGTVWARGYHVRRISGDGYAAASKYVENHKSQGCLIVHIPKPGDLSSG